MSVKISGNIDTKNPADVYATHLGNLTKGGVHTKDSIASMNSIPVERRTRMMLCVVGDTGSGSPALFWLNTPVNPTSAQLADNNYWEIVPLGTSIDGILKLLGFENGAALTITDAVGNTGDTYIADSAGSGTNGAIFGGAPYNINVGDYLVYESTVWHVVPTGATSVTWSTLPGKPTTFAPTAHSHTVANLIDFPDLSSYLTNSSVAATILDETDDLFLATVLAIKTYVGEEIVDITFPTVDLSNYYTKSETTALLDAIEGYTLYTSPSLVQLAIDVPTPNENEFAYIQGEFAMYKYISAAWVSQYTTSLPSDTEAEWLNSDVETVAQLKAKGTTSLSLNNYTIFRNTDDANRLNIYKLVGGNDAESLPDIVRPNDYVTTTNEKVWILAVYTPSPAGTVSGAIQLRSTSGLALTADDTLVFVNSILGIGNAVPNSNAKVDIVSTTKGFLLPRMTTVQRTTLGDSLVVGDVGMKVYDTDLLQEQSWNGTEWIGVGDVLKNTMSQTLNFIDLTTFFFTQGQDYKIISVVEQSGVTATIKLGGTATDYILGDIVSAFDVLDITVDILGAITIKGELL